jgi:hypothetical protein
VERDTLYNVVAKDKALPAGDDEMPVGVLR